MNIETKTYIDEAGNTGDDLTSQEQPYFIYAAVTLTTDQERAVVETLKTEFARWQGKGEPEIKAAKWAYVPRKAKSLEAIIDKILAVGGRITVVVVEKRFMVAAKIVDTFFDPVYNDIEDWDWVNNHDKKVEAANYFYDLLNDEQIQRFRNILHTPQKEEVAAFLEFLIGSMENEEYKNLFLGARAYVEKITNDMDSSDHEKANGYGKGAMLSPNYTAFHTMGNMLAQHCHQYGIITELVFDNSRQFNRSVQDITNTFQRAKHSILLPDGKTVLYSWKDVITNISIADSKDENCLQLADIIASAVNNYLVKIRCGSISKCQHIDHYINFRLINMLTVKQLFFLVSNAFYTYFSDMVVKLAESFTTTPDDHPRK